MSLFFGDKVFAQSTSFSFGAAGDFANGSNFGNVTNSIRQQNPNLFLALGDLAYTTAEQNWCSKWGTFTNLLLVTGNHDSGESSSGNIETYIANCPRAGVNIVGTYGHNYYFDYPVNNPIARFVMVRPGVGGSYGSGAISYAVGGTGYTFTSNAIDDARARGIKWVVVGMHKNYISVMEKGNEVGTPFMTLLFNKKVDLVLQGHEHGYERSKQLSCATAGTYVASCVSAAGGNFIQGQGLVIDVLGTGGQGFRGLNTTDSEYPYFEKSTNVSSNYGWGKFIVSPSQIAYSYINVGGGGLVDSFTITNDPNITPVPVATNTPTIVPTNTIRPTNTPTPIPTATPIPGQPTNTPQPNTPTPTLSTCAAIPTTFGVATGSVSIASTGQYVVWSRMMAGSSTSNAYYLQIDSGCPILVGDLATMATNSWVWVDYMNGQTGSRILQTLSAGTHSIRVVGKENGLKLDSLVFANNLNCVPVNNGSNCTLPVVTATIQPSVMPTSTVVPTVITTPVPSTQGAEVVPVEDSYVTAVYPNITHANVTELFIDGDPTKITYMKFDTRGYLGKNISSAKLRFKITASKDAPSVSPQRVRQVANTSWTEETLTFANRPDLGTILATNSGGGVANQWIQLDITSFVKSNIGTVFTLAIDSPRADGMNISSSEAVVTNRPRIVLSY